MPEINEETLENEEMLNEAADTDIPVTEETTEEAAQEAEKDKAEENKAEEQDAKTSKSGLKDRKGKKFQKELEKKDEEIADLTDRFRRLMAEFDNYKKRTDVEKTMRYDDGAMGALVKILPVVDNFERGLAQIPEESKSDPYAEGMDKIYKQLIKVLEDLGVTAIDTEGKEFDPNFHNAVLHIEDENYDENVVAEELQKGYMYKDSVLRYSMVKVAN